MRAVYICLAVLMLLVGCSKEPPEYESRYTPTPTTAPSYPPPPPLAAPAGAKAVFVGDSWTQGFSADPLESGFAYLTMEAMGWRGPVLGADGTGYMKGKNGVPPYAERIAALPDDLSDAQIVIVQGSVNDAQMADAIDFPATADRTIDAVRARFPSAAIVLFGPCLHTTAPAHRIRILDKNLGDAVRRNNVHYLSCIQRDWIDDANIGAVIDPQTQHPSTEGHAYLAQRLTAALRELTAPAGHP